MAYCAEQSRSSIPSGYPAEFPIAHPARRTPKQPRNCKTWTSRATLRTFNRSHIHNVVFIVVHLPRNWLRTLQNDCPRKNTLRKSVWERERSRNHDRARMIHATISILSFDRNNRNSDDFLDNWASDVLNVSWLSTNHSPLRVNYTFPELSGKIGEPIMSKSVCFFFVSSKLQLTIQRHN